MKDIKNCGVGRIVMKQDAAGRIEMCPLCERFIDLQSEREKATAQHGREKVTVDDSI